MARQTSIDVYNAIKANGLIGRMQFAAYDWLFKNGPATGREIFAGITNEPDQHTRFTELRDKGLFREIGKRMCKVTGHTTGKPSILWDVTDRLPVKPPKKTYLLSKLSMKALGQMWVVAYGPDKEALRRVIELAKLRTQAAAEEAP